MRLRERPEWKFFGVLPKANGALAIAWWVVLVLRGVLPAMHSLRSARRECRELEVTTQRASR